MSGYPDREVWPNDAQADIDAQELSRDELAREVLDPAEYAEYEARRKRRLSW